MHLSRETLEVTGTSYEYQGEVIKISGTEIKTTHFSAEDLTDLYRVYGNPEVMRFIDKTGKTLSETEVELNSYIDHWKQHGFGNFAIIHKASNTLIGRTGLYQNQRSPYPQFGYILDQPYWGQGLGTELALANLDYGFNILQFETIAAFVMVDNWTSRKIKGKIGNGIINGAICLFIWNIGLLYHCAIAIFNPS